MNVARFYIDVLPGSEKALWKCQNGPLANQAFEFLIPSEYLRSLTPHPDPLRSLLSVRQAGATTVWISVDREVPAAVYARSRSGDRLGYIERGELREGSVQLRSELVDQIAKDLSGYVAEEMVFGEVSLSSIDDLRSASQKVALMLQAGLGNQENPWLLDPMMIPRNSFDIEHEADAIVLEARARARCILEIEKEFFQTLSKKLYDQTFVQKPQLETLLQEAWFDRTTAQFIASGNPAIHPCVKMLEAFAAEGRRFQFRAPQSNRGTFGFGK